ncbi:hypothetical protein YC2023_005158 [Brassica napus]
MKLQRLILDVRNLGLTQSYVAAGHPRWLDHLYANDRSASGALMCSWISLSNPFFVVVVKQAVLLDCLVVWNQEVWEKEKGYVLAMDMMNQNLYL